MDPVKGDNLRASDAERAQVRQILERAVGAGMLTLDEYVERVDIALAARTRGELNAVLADLPEPHLGTPRTPIPPQREPEELRGWMSTIERRGQWTVTPTVRLNTRLCSTTLDFTSAVLSGPVVHIDIDDYCSTTTLIVPANATADLNGIHAVAGSATVKVRTSPPSDQLHLVVRGKVRMGSVTVRHSYTRWLRRLSGSR
ncbi:DUF1707 SHOCT-like domain-containing protein [Mycolicibacterium goodii]|uniref:DUF1707 domain-containing protein n=1 Tax=Mycolicibacterium goodii TaxID=134601 RepID=A0ABS6HLZ1_MYCGD|nr:DUF1707 domain-containing protein [Mycolicibacterium goodii]MBU8823641.1 DUF1707 domain-containing protein [Mycolicibacterium goodii]MBU8835812.1 DUF1707 domain-containing protein [Mycolicibacterium goodii]ULN46927.1 DUF1707 domain-containing protein [Mycolicibacterium goodii]